MLQSAPMLMTEHAGSKPLVIGTPHPVLPPRFYEAPFGELDRLRLALDKLEARILEVYKSVADVEQRLHAIPGSEDDKSFDAIRDQIT